MREIRQQRRPGRSETSRTPGTDHIDTPRKQGSGELRAAQLHRALTIPPSSLTNVFKGSRVQRQICCGSFNRVQEAIVGVGVL